MGGVDRLVEVLVEDFVDVVLVVPASGGINIQQIEKLYAV